MQRSYSEERKPSEGRLHENRNMVSENRMFDSMKPSSVITWNGDWDSYKRRMRAAGILNGLQKALKRGEALASKGIVTEKETKEQVTEWPEDMKESSEKLAAVLLLSLESTRGPQQSIVVNRSSTEEENGILMWADLVRHFEKGSVELKMSDLQKEWEENEVKRGEHPNELYGRLIAINSKLKNLGAGYTEDQLQMRFVAAVEKDVSRLYTSAMQQYRGAQICGNGWDMAILLEFLTHVHDTNKRDNPVKPEMKGLAMPNVVKCAHCNKRGHKEENCWSKYPEKQPRGKRGMSNPKCYKCGKIGHMKKDCNSVERKYIAARLNMNDSENVIECYLETLIDSASSCHTVASLSLLDEGTVENVNRTVKAANGKEIMLTHKGKRTIRTRQGTLALSEVYYGSEIAYNLISVPLMIEKGVNVTLATKGASIRKGNTEIPLRKIDGLWALPEENKTSLSATLRMEIGGKADAETWHKRLGHVSNYKLKKMIDEGSVPTSAGMYDASNCQTCQLTNPRRRHVPSHAERSGQVTVQVDFMPIGQEYRGLNGEVGAYVYSSRYSKMVKSYPVGSVSAKEAAQSLEKYCTCILPFLGENVDCFQTDAGTQFMSKEWAEMCRKRNVMHRTCPIDHQAMNGQVERAQGMLAAKIRAFLMDGGMEKGFWPLAMETATYSKTLPPINNCVDFIKNSGKTGLRYEHRHTVVQLLNTRARQGALMQYPLLVLMRNHLTTKQVRKALRLAGVTPGQNPLETAWGVECAYAASDSILPYTEMCALAGRVGGSRNTQPQ